MSFIPRIAIVGGGPSGLALGLLLQQRGIQPTIYELRSKPTTEELAKPSGMLDLHEESGQKVLRECGLWDDFQAALGDCSEACRVLNTQGVVLHTDEGQLSSRPEIPRYALTEMLIKNLDCIKWSHKIIAVRETRNSTTDAIEITIDLENSTATYDLVIGADGAWSRVRPLLVDTKPSYDDTQLLTVTVRNASTKFPHLVELNGSGTLMALGGCNGIMTHRGPQDSIRVYAAMSTPEEHWVKLSGLGLAGKTATEIKRTLLADDKLYGKWAPNLQDLLSITCDEDTKDNPGPADISPLYSLPIGHSWPHHSTATLIGDAAHLMTPWAGEGVNLALHDALDLAHVLGDAAVVGTEDAVAWQAALAPRLRAHEEVMWERAKEKAEESARNKELLLSENGAQNMADMFHMYHDMAAAGGPPE